MGVGRPGVGLWKLAAGADEVEAPVEPEVTAAAPEEVEAPAPVEEAVPEPEVSSGVV